MLPVHAALTKVQLRSRRWCVEEPWDVCGVSSPAKESFHHCIRILPAITLLRTESLMPAVSTLNALNTSDDCLLSQAAQGAGQIILYITSPCTARESTTPHHVDAREGSSNFGVKTFQDSFVSVVSVMPTLAVGIDDLWEHSNGHFTS